MLQEHGTKTNANKAIAELVLSLTDLYNEDHEYGTLFNRILQINSPEPIDKVLGLFLVKARMEFQKIIIEN